MEVNECNQELFEFDMSTSGLSSWKKHHKEFSKKIQRGSSKQCCRKYGYKAYRHTNDNKPLRGFSLIKYVPDELYESIVYVKK